MKVQDFLTAIQSCPEERLRDDWGIGNNFLIQIGGDYDSECRKLVETLGWPKASGFCNKRNKHQWYQPSSAIIAHLFPSSGGILRFPSPSFFRNAPLDFYAPDQIEAHIEKQDRLYSFGITFHSSMEAMAMGTNYQSDMRAVITTLTLYLISQSTNFCIPGPARERTNYKQKPYELNLDYIIYSDE